MPTASLCKVTSVPRSQGCNSPRTSSMPSRSGVTRSRKRGWSASTRTISTNYGSAGNDLPRQPPPTISTRTHRRSRAGSDEERVPDHDRLCRPRSDGATLGACSWVPTRGATGPGSGSSGFLRPRRSRTASISISSSVGDGASLSTSGSSVSSLKVSASLAPEPPSVMRWTVPNSTTSSWLWPIPRATRSTASERSFGRACQQGRRRGRLRS
jgi:hypothetical protein